MKGGGRGLSPGWMCCMANESVYCPAGPRPFADPRIASIRHALDQAAIDLLLAFPPDGSSTPESPRGADALLARLLDLKVADPAGLVAIRVQLVEPCCGGLRLSRLGRAVASAIRAQA